MTLVWGFNLTSLQTHQANAGTKKQRFLSTMDRAWPKQGLESELQIVLYNYSVHHND